MSAHLRSMLVGQESGVHVQYRGYARVTCIWCVPTGMSCISSILIFTNLFNIQAIHVSKRTQILANKIYCSFNALPYIRKPNITSSMDKTAQKNEYTVRLDKTNNDNPTSATT